MRQGEPAFGHHLDEVSKAELVAQIPAHAEDNDFTIEVATFEEFVHVRQARRVHRSTNLPGTMPRSCGLHQSPRDQVVGVVGAAGDSLSQSAAAAQDKFAAVEGDVEARIKKNPWGAVAVAGLIGLLIGKMS